MYRPLQYIQNHEVNNFCASTWLHFQTVNLVSVFNGTVT
jgi:hypothetical protein